MCQPIIRMLASASTVPNAINRLPADVTINPEVNGNRASKANSVVIHRLPKIAGNQESACRR